MWRRELHSHSHSPDLFRECKRSKAIIVHPTKAIVVNEKHEKAKREWPRVPLEVMQLIVKKIDDVRTVVNFALTSKFFSEKIQEDDELWKNLYLAKAFPKPSTKPNGKWRELFIFQPRFIRDVLLNKNLDEILEKAYPRWESVGAISLPVRS